MDIRRGMRGKIFDIFDNDKQIEVTMKTKGNAVYDYCCFGVDEKDLLSDDRYMIFYNQSRSPADEIIMRNEDEGSVFEISLDKLPDTVKKLVFTASIDGEKNMSGIEKFDLGICQEGHEPLRLGMTGNDFSAERAIITIEIYKKAEWRYSVVAQGFNGGLSDLLEHYGGEEILADDQAADDDSNTSDDTSQVSANASAETVQIPLAKPEEKPEEEPEKVVPSAAEGSKMISLAKIGNSRIDLRKNDKIELRKKNDKPLTQFIVGLGWDPAKAGASIDCDSSVFLCKGGKLCNEDDIVSFYNKRHSSGAVIHGGDNLTGHGSGDDERITISLDRVPAGYDRIIIVVNIFLSRITRQHFGKIRNCYMRLFDTSGKELCRYTLSDNSEYNKKSAMIFGEFTKENECWIFHAIGEGTKDHSIGSLAKRFKR